MANYKCPECKKRTAKYDKGAYICTNSSCRTIWWSAFDKPAAGKSRRGFNCGTCGNGTVHPLATLDTINIWRCSKCATTTIKPVDVV